MISQTPLATLKLKKLFFNVTLRFHFASQDHMIKAFTHKALTIRTVNIPIKNAQFIVKIWWKQLFFCVLLLGINLKFFIETEKLFLTRLSKPENLKILYSRANCCYPHGPAGHTAQLPILANQSEAVNFLNFFRLPPLCVPVGNGFRVCLCCLCFLMV